MKNSTPFNTKPTIEPTKSSGSTSSRNVSYGVDSEIVIDDFDPALELKRLRQELIERLLIIQRKAALNAQSDNQKQLSVTIVPKPIQSSPITRPKLTESNGIRIDRVERNHNQSANKENSRKDVIYSESNLAPDSIDDPARSAERIMANIESARVCISQLQTPNINQPHLKMMADKLTEQQNCSRNNRQTADNLSAQNRQLNSNTNEQKLEHHLSSRHLSNGVVNEFNCNENSDNFVTKNQSNQQSQQNQYNLQTLKSEVAGESFGIILLQKLNFGLSLIGVIGILIGVFYLFSGGIGNFQPGVPVLFVGLLLIVAGLTGHLLQDYVNTTYQINHQINHSSTNT
ncbi:MAG: hypothetical protein LBB88_09695 [Planctomycetaceae bacterium]|jgi:ribosomal protein L32|nr:hypothetical protein [Planctomycetaceae bacterium]